MQLPVNNGRITQTYGHVNTKHKYAKGYHSGLDVTSDDLRIHNVTYSTVIVVGNDPDGWGKYVICRGMDGHDIIYAHLSKVQVSQAVILSAGDVIGIMGATGNSSGIHLHFEVRKGNWKDKNDINAAEYLNVKNEGGLLTTDDPYEDDRQWVMKRKISDGTDPLRPVLRREVWAMIRRAIEGR